MVAQVIFREENPELSGGRLTLESGVPISSSDQTGKTTIYYAPYLHNRTSLFVGGRWRTYQFSELSLALGTLSSGANYDVFAYPSGATAALELSNAWSSDTARSQALTTQDGIYVKSGATNRRYLGSFRTTATTTTEDSAANRLVWNMDNRVEREVIKYENGAAIGWSYGKSAWRPGNNSTANRIGILVGLSGLSLLNLSMNIESTTTTAGAARGAGIGFDTASTNSANINSLPNIDGGFVHHESSLYRYVTIGYHYCQWVEYGGTNVSFGGTSADTTLRRAGLNGTIQC